MQSNEFDASMTADPGGPDRIGPSRGEDPDRIGPYRILRVLGEGGMGVVYLAEQTEPVRRQDALKILKLGMDTRQVVARFDSERQALAVMEHAGIAKVFDAGATEAGRPFFVMERVDGVPITEFCDDHALGLRERVRLFVQVCRAVQHAHQKGVIHRDLKPSNVLVTEADGAPLCKIIDFGIARATEQSAEERTRLTQHDQSLGTPAYMSPEQAIGSDLDIDTRTDIYSLGVLLYELLAGVLPFEPEAYRGWAFLAPHDQGAAAAQRPLRGPA
jgi:eukaryotic-like serine/threonine-protein kinase